MTADRLTAFAGTRRVASGSRAEVAASLWKRREGGDDSLILLFDEAGRALDLDLRGTLDDVRARYAESAPDSEPAPRRGRGRPKLGVVGREVTLLPRHWEWLQSQRGGPSATLRRLVDEARTRREPEDERAEAQDVIQRFLSAMAGNLPGFEEATRALYRVDRARFEQESSAWPSDIRRWVRPWLDAAFR